MKKTYKFLGFMAVLFLWGTSAVAAQEIEYALNESFEQGLPDGWTQEHVSGSVDWIAETGGDYPAGAADGQGRMALRNTTGQTQGFVTRLVTPVMDLDGVYQPILIFSHAQEHNLGDVDELRVYYRTSPTSDWVLYGEDGVFTERIRTWQTDTILLSGMSSTYQIAFEGTDHFGNGIVLDKVQVRPMPMCTDPIFTLVDMATSTSFRVNWRASNDSQSYAVKLDTTRLDDPEAATADDVLLDTVVTTRNCLFENLEVRTTYYVYIQANCGGESSGWTEYSYTTQAIANLPYTEGFNMDYNAGYVYKYPATWLWGNSWGESSAPFVNANTAVGDRGNYSPDKTTAVCFASGRSISTPIDANQLCYLISPELQTDDLSAYQVSFWVTAYEYVGEEYASSLIVGIVEDPNSIASFTPLDTVTVKESLTFSEFVVPFSKYTGKGKYVVFASYFDKPNIMYLDNVSFDLAPACPKITEVEVTDVRETEATLMCNLLGASSWEIVLTAQPEDDPANASSKVWSASNLTSVPYKMTEIPDGMQLYAYVRATCGADGNGEWSDPVVFRTLCKGTLPMTFGFEYDNPEEPVIPLSEYDKEWSETRYMPACMITWGNANNLQPPYIHEGDARTGRNSLYVYHPLPDRYVSYVAFPKLENIKEAKLSFYVRVQGEDESFLEHSHLVIGVMSDPHDLSTFDSIAAVEADSYEEWKRCEVYFSQYQGEGKYPAMRDYGDYTLVDDVLFEEISGCPLATNLDATPLATYAGDSVYLSWYANGATKFRILIDTQDMTDQLPNLGSTYRPLIDTIVSDVDEVTLGGLTGNTPYYATIQSMCGEDGTAWWPVLQFTTECPEEVISLPYEEDFEGYQGAAKVAEIPDCWTTTFKRKVDQYSTTYYPYISAYSDLSSLSGQYLVLNYSKSGGYRDYVALPRFAEDWENLQLSFAVKQSDANSLLVVGVLPNLADTTTFVPLDTVAMNGDAEYNIWREEVIRFRDYDNIPDGNIMLLQTVPSSSQAASYSSLDNVVVDYVNDCNRPENLSVKDVTGNSATLCWVSSGVATQWDVMVLNNTSRLPDVATEDDIVYHGLTTGGQPELALTEDLAMLAENTEYWYYVRAVCAPGDTTDWTLTPCSFRTGCSALTVDLMGTETFDENTRFGCWTTGVGEGTTNPPTINKKNDEFALYIFNSATSNNTYAIMPEIDIDSITRLQMKLSFLNSDSRATNVGRLLVGVITDPNDLSTFACVDTVSGEYNQWVERTVRFDTYKGDDYGNFGKRIMFYSSKNSEAKEMNYTYIDNIRLDTIPTCFEPTSMWTDSLSYDAAILAWEDMDASSYEVRVSTMPLSEEQLDAGEGEQYLVQDTTRLALTGLSPLTTYYTYVRTLCSADDYSFWSPESSFYTDCPPAWSLPYMESFDDYGTGSQVMPCWNYYYTTNGTSASSGYPSLATTYNNTVDGVAAMYMFAANNTKSYTLGISPEIQMSEGVDMSSLRISFDALSANVDETFQLVVGITRYPDSLTLDGFVPVDTISLPGSVSQPVEKKWYPFVFDLDGLSALENIEEYKHVVLASIRALNTNSAGLYVDNLIVEVIPPCETPTGVKVSSTREDRFIVSWDAVSGDRAPASWNVEYGPKGFAQGQGTMQTGITANSYEITGLTANTEYDVYVQGVAASGETTRWIQARGRTIYQPVTEFPYVCNFENEEENAAWVLLNDEAVNAWYVGEACAKDGDKALYISKDGGQTADYTKFLNASVWAVRTLKLEKGQYTVSFDWTCSGNGTNDFLRAGLLPADALLTTSITTTQGTVMGADGSQTTMAQTEAGTPSEWISLEGVDAEGEPIYRLNGVDVTGKEIDWRSVTTTFEINAEKAGYYNLVFYWRNATTTIDLNTEPSAVVDNIQITKSPCPPPFDLRYTRLGDTYVDLIWDKLDDSQNTWNMKVFSREVGIDSIAEVTGDELLREEQLMNDTTYRLEGLESFMPYYIYLQSDCGEGSQSNWVGVKAQTTCAPTEVGYVWTFEEEDGYSTTPTTSNMAPGCWIVGNKMKPTSAAYIPYKIENTNSYTYSMSNGLDGQHALYIYSYWTTSTSSRADGAYAIMPPVDAESLDGLQLHFFARAAYARDDKDADGYKISTTYTTSSYAHSIVVGTIVDPLDLNTFVPDTTIVLSERKTSEYANESNDWLFDEIIVPLDGAAGRYVMFLSEFGMSNRIYIDNLSIEKAGDCERPLRLVAQNVTSDGTQLTWDGGSAAAWTVTVATDEGLKNVVKTEDVQTDTCVIEGLQPSTTYYAAVQANCGDGIVSRQSTVVSFTTTHVIPYNEQFTTAAHNPDGWTRYDMEWNMTDVLSSLGTPQLPTATSVTSAWVRNSGGVSPHQYVRLRGEVSLWMVSPRVELPELPTDGGLWLTFDLMLTNEDSFDPMIPSETNTDDRFVVAISDDGGATWKPENTFVWDNDTIADNSDYVLNDISSEFETVRFNLDKYAGKVIQVAFYAESTKKSTDEPTSIDLHIDNVHVNRYVEENLEVPVCGGYDYEGEGFYVTYDNLQVGENTFNRLSISNTAEVPDSIVNLTLLVSEVPTYTIEATTCEGEPYENYDFVVAAGESGEFKRKLKCEDTGCDSVAVLKLNIIETLRVQLMDTICQGQTYDFGGQQLNRTGVFLDTVTSLVTGCDSITTLVLTVRDAMRTTLSEVACFGEPYTFGELTLTESGQYIDTLRTDAGCDSIVTLNLTVREEILPTHIYGYVCPDETYSDDHFTGVPAVNDEYELTVATDWGACDSLLVLHLTVLDDDTVYTEYRIDEDELPFTYHGQTYEVGETGVHVQTLEVTSQSGNCSAVLVATLTIGDNVGMGMTQGGTLSIVPTLINRGQSVRLSGAGATELEVAVFDMTGRLVFHDESMAMPAELRVFDASGIYTVKAIDGNGQVMYGRVIVK